MPEEKPNQLPPLPPEGYEITIRVLPPMEEGAHGYIAMAVDRGGEGEPNATAFLLTSRLIHVLRSESRRILEEAQGFPV